MDTLNKLAVEIVNVINGILVPLIFAAAFIVFLFGVFRFMIAGAANPEKRQSGVQFIMYSLIGFFVMISVWGLVNLLVGTFGFDNTNRPCLPTFKGSSGCAGGLDNVRNEAGFNQSIEGLIKENEANDTKEANFNASMEELINGQ